MSFKNLTVARKLWAIIVSIVAAMALAAFLSQLFAGRAYKQALESVASHDARIQTALKWRGYTDGGIHALVSKARATEAALNEMLAERISKSIANSKRMYESISAEATTPREKAALATVAQARQHMVDLTVRVEEVKKAEDPAGLTRLIEQELRPAADKYLGSLDDFVVLQETLRDEAQRDALAHAQAVEQLGWLAGSVVMGLSLLMAGVLARSLTGPLADAVQAAQAIAGGDLSSRLVSDRGDEIGQLLRAIAQMAEQLRQLVADVRQGVDSVSTASSQIAVGNQDLSGRTEQMATSLQETASSMEELTATVAQSADTAQQASQLAAAAARSAQLGGEAVAKVVASMAGISEDSRRIADILATIDGIAFQTNILALNAAVEAARAGEHGRGFAVVAGEVRGLAQRSADAAKEIKKLITASSATVASGSLQVEQTGRTMQEIVDHVSRVAQLINEIAVAASEQRDGISQVNGAVGSLDQVTQQNAALVEESAAAAESLRNQAQRLADVVAVFQVGQDRRR